MLYIIRNSKDEIQTQTTDWEVAYFSMSVLAKTGALFRLEIRGREGDILLCG